MIFAGLLFGIVMTMKLFPEMPAARAMHRAFVEVPLATIAEWDRRHLIFGVVAVVMAFSCSQTLLMMGASDMLMILAWDVSLYVDAVIATYTAAVVTRVKGFWQYLKMRALRPFRSARPRAPRRVRVTARPAANDSDGDGSGWSYALAA